MESILVQDDGIVSFGGVVGELVLVVFLQQRSSSAL